MTNRERFKKVMNFEQPDRLPMIEWAGYWEKTTQRWYDEGLPKNLQDPWDIRKYFGFDSYRQYWIIPRHPDCPVAPYHGAPIITNADEYHKLKSLLYPRPAFDEKLVRQYALEQKQGTSVVWITLEGFFWFPRTLLGIERHLYSFYDQPNLIHQINDDITKYHLQTLEEFCRICVPDFMTFAEDMSYNNGPMLSKSTFDNFLKPYYRRVVPQLKRLGIIPFVDSDGDVIKLLPWLDEVGIEGILPLERMAGVNIAQIRKQFPRLRLIGAFDKTIMHKGPAALKAEFERLLPQMQQGGFIPSVDHQTPPDVSLENYRSYINLLRDYCTKAASHIKKGTSL